ncbi:hypothetical protein [Ruminococcus sp.]|uniref:hypothetical protein n=1 Tax=Ruminococcus sp. TaxID=41978 RepID=UPI003890A798
MAKYVVVEENVESKSEKRVRIFLAVLFFIQIILLPLPLMQGTVVIDGVEGVGHRTALNLLFQYNGFNSFSEVMVAIYGAILIIMPIVSFFFCILDKRSIKKYIVSGITCVLCAVIICFGPKDSIAIGGVLTLILNVLTLFMTSQGFQATRMRERESGK